MDIKDFLACHEVRKLFDVRIFGHTFLLFVAKVQKSYCRFKYFYYICTVFNKLSGV